MTHEQYQRWQDFAMRMARTCFVRSRRPDAAWITEVVGDFFGRIDPEDVVGFVDWDNSLPYPEGHSYYRRAYRCPCWNCSRLDAKSPCPYNCEAGEIYDYAKPMLMGDMVSSFLDDHMRGSPRCRACTDYTDDGECRCDEIEEKFMDQWDEQWGGPVRCCIRAGMDLASSPSAGVVGFTACDLRRMYPEGIPDWINQFFDGDGEPVDLNTGDCRVGVWL